ncbi:MAG: DNA polymerase III subunit delta [Candidatus Competibacteraceae bacterium]|jgi:DNA polymerase-3 subunit delta|nr:DNA polymerase III subunit delta [Candidatus Competibacteraceae bacterium]
MRLRAEQLAAHFAKPLASIYVVFGDEPLLVQESTDAIRQAARVQGYTERVSLTVETGFDWNTLEQSAANQSLFADRRLLELRLGAVKPGDAGGKALYRYAQRPPADVVLLVSCAKLDAAAQKSRWFTALDNAGITIPLWPVNKQQLPRWIEQRLVARGLHPDQEAAGLLAERVEGNLLAAVQEIEKLHLLLGPGTVTTQQVLAAVSDSARYTVYELVDAALAGQPGRMVRILHGLRDEGVDIVLVAWALHREIELLNRLAFAATRGQALEAALSENKVWESRKPLLRSALRRLPLQTCRQLLNACAQLDRVVKGAEPGEPWDIALQVGMQLAGRALQVPSDSVY